MADNKPQYYDVFNGDADGICALHQLRMAEPLDAQLITGVKRDIKLLAKIHSIRNAKITVLDISLDSNRSEVMGLLRQNCDIRYFDHHFAGTIPESPNFESHINPNPDTCTSMIVNEYLEERYPAWAIAGAFGDNQHKSAQALAEAIGLSSDSTIQLRELGELLNYNGYGLTTADLHFTPEDLYVAVHGFEDPFEFFLNSEVLAKLRQGYNDDMYKAMQLGPMKENAAGRIYSFPNEPWARRVAGVFVNSKARENEALAHALLIDNGNQTSMVSVRAPLSEKNGADNLCRQFPTGGGRSAAAGINALPNSMDNEFLEAFDEIFGKK